MENEVNHLKIEDIIPNEERPYNECEHLDDLVESIKVHGILQPIIVKPDGSKYKIIDGNRRFFAAKMANVSKIPAFIRSSEPIRLRLEDDWNHQELSPIAEARKYKEILDNTGIKQEELANNIGKSQSALANKLRLLQLPEEVQNALDKREITERHARSLLTVKNKNQQLGLLKKIKEEKITVRELDSEIKNMSNMFIPEEFSSKNRNNVASDNNFVSNDNNFVSGNNSFIPSGDNFMPNNNGFIPNNNLMPNDIVNNYGNNMMNNNSYQNPTNEYNQMPINNSGNMNNFNYQNNSLNQETSNGISPNFDNSRDNVGMNPFLTNNDYIPPTPPREDQMAINPFSSIRMNSMQNNQNNINENMTSNPFFVDNNQNNLNESQFNINDYRLPDYSDNSITNSASEKGTNSFNDTVPLNNFNGEFNNIDQTSMANDQSLDDNTSNTENTSYKYVEDNPNYVSVDKPHGVSSVDDVIEVLREALNKIKNGQIKVDTEEIDYDESYQITIRIDKKGSF